MSTMNESGGTKATHSPPPPSSISVKVDFCQNEDKQKEKNKKTAFFLGFAFGLLRCANIKNYDFVLM